MSTFYLQNLFAGCKKRVNMKTPSIKPLWKFFAGTLFYALVLAVLSCFNDYRIVIYGFMLMNALAFSMALAALIKSKAIVALILCGALALAPAQAGEQPPPPPEKDSAVLAGCAILIVGAIIVYGLWKLCKKLPSLPPTTRNPPVTNPPPNPNFVFGMDTNGPALVMPDWKITQLNDWDTAVMTFQSSTNGADWKDEYTVTNWFNNAQFVSIIYSNGLPLMTNFGPCYWTNGTMVSDFGPVMPAKETMALRLWRGVQLQ
jgi:hypothetical protein